MSNNDTIVVVTGGSGYSKFHFCFCFLSIVPVVERRKSWTLCRDVVVALGRQGNLFGYEVWS